MMRDREAPGHRAVGVRPRMLASVASIAAVTPVRVRRRGTSRASRRRACRRCRAGAARLARLPGRERAARSIQPPSTSASAATTPGWRAATSTTTLPPHDCPATIAPVMPRRPATAATSAAAVVGVVAGRRGVGLAVRAQVDRGTTGWPAAARTAPTPSHSRALDDRPWTSTKGRLSLSAAHCRTCSVTPSATATRRSLGVMSRGAASSSGLVSPEGSPMRPT